MARIFLIDATAVPSSSPFLAQPVGLLSLAAVLRREGHEVAVHDCKLEIFTLPSRLAEFEPDFVGIRTLSVFLNVLSYVAEVVNRVVPEAQVIVGGPHASLDPGDAIRRSGASAAVLGEGEVTIVELLATLQEHGPLAQVKGIAFADNGGVERTAPREPIEDLDSLPMPAYDLVPVEQYFALHHGGTAPGGRTLTVFTSRGCPFACAFCHNLFGRRFRARSADSVVSELTYLQRRYGVEEFELHDDAFNTNRKRVMDICAGLQRARERTLLAFPNGLRGDTLDREQLEELRRAGTHHLALSPETATERLQRLIGKRMDLDKLLQAADDCDALGIFTVGYFMLGFPSETKEEMEATVEWACKSPLHTASFFAVNPFPGTRLADMALEEGKPVADSFDGYFGTNVNVSAVDDREFRRIWHGAYRRFYLSPRRVAAILRSVPNGATLFRNSLFVAARLLNQ